MEDARRQQPTIKSGGQSAKLLVTGLSPVWLHYKDLSFAAQVAWVSWRDSPHHRAPLRWTVGPGGQDPSASPTVPFSTVLTPSRCSTATSSPHPYYKRTHHERAPQPPDSSSSRGPSIKLRLQGNGHGNKGTDDQPKTPPLTRDAPRRLWELFRVELKLTRTGDAQQQNVSQARTVPR